MSAASDVYKRQHLSNVISLHSFSTPRIKLKGNMKLVDKDEEAAFFKSHYGEEVGPVQMDNSILGLIELGDTLKLSLAKFGQQWRILDSDGIRIN